MTAESGRQVKTSVSIFQTASVPYFFMHSSQKPYNLLISLFSWLPLRMVRRWGCLIFRMMMQTKVSTLLNPRSTQSPMNRQFVFQILGAWYRQLATDFEDFKQVIKLAMDIPTDRYRRSYRHSILLLHQNLLGLHQSEHTMLQMSLSSFSGITQRFSNLRRYSSISSDCSIFYNIYVFDGYNKIADICDRINHIYWCHLSQQQPILNIEKGNKMTEQESFISVARIKELLRDGLQAIPPDRFHSQATLIIGDTGVGKSTLLSYLSGKKMITKFDGIKVHVDAQQENNSTRIEHNKLSGTFVPTKVLIKDMVFYDCAGFRDNNGEEYEIANSFFLQRLVDIYRKIKIVLVIDQSHISESRADKMPRLLHSLYQSFRTFEDIKAGCCLMVSRADREATEQDYKNELLELMKVHNENLPLFKPQERSFLEYLIANNRIILFREPEKLNNAEFAPEPFNNYLLNSIDKVEYSKSRCIGNILSEGTRLAIRELIDRIILQSDNKIVILCSRVKDECINKLRMLGDNLDGILELKKQVSKFRTDITQASKENVIRVLADRIKGIIGFSTVEQVHSITLHQLTDLEEDYTTILFFKKIENRIDQYYTAIVNKVSHQSAAVYDKIDERLTQLEHEQIQKMHRQSEKLQQNLLKQSEIEDCIKRESNQEIIDRTKKIQLKQQRRRQKQESMKKKAEEEKVAEQIRQQENQRIQQNYWNSLKEIQKKRLQGQRKAEQIKEIKRQALEQQARREEEEKVRQREIQLQNKKRMQVELVKVKLENEQRQRKLEEKTKTNQNVKNAFLKKREEWESKRKEQLAARLKAAQKPSQSQDMASAQIQEEKGLQKRSEQGSKLLCEEAQLTPNKLQHQNDPILIQEKQAIQSPMIGQMQVKQAVQSPMIGKIQVKQAVQQPQTEKVQASEGTSCEKSSLSDPKQSVLESKSTEPDSSTPCSNDTFGKTAQKMSPHQHGLNLKQMRMYWQKKCEQQDRIYNRLERQRKQYEELKSQRQRRQQVKQQQEEIKYRKLQTDRQIKQRERQLQKKEYEEKIMREIEEEMKRNRLQMSHQSLGKVRTIPKNRYLSKTFSQAASPQRPIPRKQLISQIANLMSHLQLIEGDLHRAKSNAINLHNRSMQIRSEFERIQQTYSYKNSKIHLI